MRTIHFHGELQFSEVDNNNIPKDAKRVEVKGDFKLADSEATGNHHMLQVRPGVELFSFDDKFYVKTREETKAYCVLEERHDDLILPAGTSWEIGRAKETDHLTRSRRLVMD